MPQDAITLCKTATELNSMLCGAKVNKIIQPTSDELILLLYTRFGIAKLDICVNAVGTRVGLTEVERKSPATPTGFCMLLRKHLLNTSIKKIETIYGERIVKITFDGKNDFMEYAEKELYAEIMGKYSNAIFCENEIILGTLKSTQLDLGKDRALIQGVKYALPKSQGKKDLANKEDFLSTISSFSFGNLDDFIFNNFQGISKQTATEIVYGFYGKNQFDLPVIKTSEFFDYIIDFLNSFTSKSMVVLNDNKPLDFFFCDYKTISGKKIFFDCLIEAETYFFDNKKILKELAEIKNKLLSAVNSRIKKEEKKLKIIAEKEFECNNSEVTRKFGELITANLYKIKRGDKFVIVNDYYNNNEELKIQLDETLSPNQNAQKYFKKYSKLRSTLKAIEPQKEQTISELEYLKSILAEINSAQNIKDFEEILKELEESGIIKKDNKDVKKKKQPEPISYRIFEYDGYKIYAGKNNIQNDKLTQSAKSSDMWLHTKDYHSAHVIIESNGKHIPDEILLIASEICAFYSEASKSDKVPVDYTLKKYVKKPPKAKYGSVIYTDFKTVYVTPSAHKNLEI